MAVTLITAVCICIVEFLAIIIMTPMAKPSLVLRFLPEDIREKGKDHPEPPKYKQMIAHSILGVFGIAFIGAIVFLGVDGLRRGYGYWQLFGRFMLVLYMNKAFDILVQDQWLVLSTNFFRRIFPETADCEGWHDRSFNTKNQIIRLIAFPFLCMLTAGIFMIFK